MPNSAGKKDYQAPELIELGSHSALVAAGGANDDIDGTYLRDGQRFATFGES